MNFMVTVAAMDTTTGVVAYSDTAADSEVGIFYVTAAQ